VINDLYLEAFLQMTRNIIRHLGIRVLAQKPDLRHRDRHRFRYVRGQKDLGPFVDLSDAEEVIAGVNPGLKGKNREKLYARWCQWTVLDQSMSWNPQENRVKSFLILDQKQSDEAWLPIGVSILLPLTMDGLCHLRPSQNERQISLRNRNAATLEGRDLARGPSTRLLLDTWIIRQRPCAPGKPLQRFEHHRWGVGLLQRHIAEFWDPDSGAEFTFLCEPDNPKIAAMLRGLRFNKETRNNAPGDLFVLKYPIDGGKLGQEEQEASERIRDNIKAIQSIPIE
jgi:hypothetical protein